MTLEQKNRRQTEALNRLHMQKAQSAQVGGVSVGWRGQSLCREVGPFLFDEPFDVIDDPRQMPTKTEFRRHVKERSAEAKKVCAVCPVADTCATVAFGQNEMYGLMAGLTHGQRRGIALRGTKLGECVQVALDALRRNANGEVDPTLRVEAAKKAAVRLAAKEKTLIRKARTNFRARRINEVAQIAS